MICCPLYHADVIALVCGMGRVGSSAYDHLQTVLNDSIGGMDFDEHKVDRNRQEGRLVIQGDASNPDLWDRIERHNHQIKLILLCMPNSESNLNAAKTIRMWGYEGNIAAVTMYADEEVALQEAGVNLIFNMYSEIGSGFAQDILNKTAQPLQA